MHLNNQLIEIYVYLSKKDMNFWFFNSEKFHRIEFIEKWYKKLKMNIKQVYIWLNLVIYQKFQ